MAKHGGNTKAKTTAERKASFLTVLSRKAGSVTDACKAINVGRHTYYDWIKVDEEFKAACEEITESLIDNAESKLHKAINNGQAWAICFFLKCRAKHRGYVERQEVSGPDGGPSMFHIVFESPKEKP